MTEIAQGLMIIGFCLLTFGAFGWMYAMADDEVMGPEWPYELSAACGATLMAALFWRYPFADPINTWSSRVLMSLLAAALIAILCAQAGREIRNLRQNAT